jgi:small-conductance mechanosensitive channel
MEKKNPYKHVWHIAILKLIPCAIICIVGSVFASHYGHVRVGDTEYRLDALIGVLVFVLFSSIFLSVFTKAFGRTAIANKLGVGRTAAIQFVLRTIGYALIILMTLNLLEIPVGRIILGSAVLGIILGVAAQQALGNFFASIVLIISHPFAVGENITLNSGALGGEYNGKVMEIGLTHTRIRNKQGNVVLLPNATLLSSAAISAENK